MKIDSIDSVPDKDALCEYCEVLPADMVVTGPEDRETGYQSVMLLCLNCYEMLVANKFVRLQ